MAKIAQQGELFPTLTPPEGTVVINDRCMIRTQDDNRLVIVSGIVLSHYALGDHMAEAYAMVTLVEHLTGGGPIRRTLSPKNQDCRELSSKDL
jgi:hypothetical protein